MATVTKTFAENQANPTAAKSTWTLTFTLNNITASGSTVTIPAPTVQGKYSAYGGKNWGQAWLRYLNLTTSNSVSIGSIEYGGENSTTSGGSWAANTNKTFTAKTASFTKNTSLFFGSGNSTTRTVNITATLGSSSVGRIVLVSATGGLGGAPTGAYDAYDSVVTIGTLATITLNAPPTIDTNATAVSGGTYDGKYIVGHSTVSFTGSRAAQYGGTISKTKLTIGSQSNEVTSGNPSIALNTVGTFTPQVLVTDSRGQTTSKNLTAITIVADNPPPFEYNQTQSSISGGAFWTDVSTATVHLYNMQSATTDGTSYYIDSVTLTIGGQSTTINNIASGTSTLDITSPTLSTQGTFTPVLTIHDTRGITRTINLNAITVQQYNTPILSFRVERTDINGAFLDEGWYSVIELTPIFQEEAVTLVAPTVEIFDKDGNTVNNIVVTWYSDRNSSGVYNAINWNTAISGKPIYGLITGTSSGSPPVPDGVLNHNYNYSVKITINDSYTSGMNLTQVLPPAFYTIDFLAEGRGIAFGMPSNQEGFYCAMDVFLPLDDISDPASIEAKLYQAAQAGADILVPSTTTIDLKKLLYHALTWN